MVQNSHFGTASQQTPQFLHCQAGSDLSPSSFNAPASPSLPCWSAARGFHLSGYHWLSLACFILYNPENQTDTHTHTNAVKHAQPGHYSAHEFEENREMAIIKTTIVGYTIIALTSIE